mgnify:CR=1 FL=1
MMLIKSDYAMISNAIYKRSDTMWLYEATLPRSSVGSIALTDNFAMIGYSMASPSGVLGAGEAYIFKWESK